MADTDVTSERWLVLYDQFTYTSVAPPA